MMIPYIKKATLNFLPFGIVVKVKSKRFPPKNILRIDSNLPEISDCESKFRHIVSVQGTGFSGSGALVDLLREYQCCLTFGSVDKEGSKTEGLPKTNGEIDFLRHAGGLFEIEHYLNDNNLFTKDALLKRFVKLVNSNVFFHHDEIRKLTCQFYNQLVAFEIDTKGQNDFNGHTADVFRPDPNIKVMNDFTLQSYRDLCRRYITAVFNVFAKKDVEYLVLDQLCGDFNYDNERNLQYIPNLKTILVYRDPRDTYCYAILKDVPWIPHDTVEKYIKWYTINLKKVKTDSKDYLVLRFEDLILNYYQTVKKVEAYLDLDESMHTRKRENLDPQESAKNIAIWKTLENHQKDFEKIKEYLPDYCYNGDE